LLAIYLDLPRNELQAIGAAGLQSHCKCCSNARVDFDFEAWRQEFRAHVAAWNNETGPICGKRNRFRSAFVWLTVSIVLQHAL
jgi:hypothetical protein